MTVKLVALLRSLPQLSQEELIDYYENNHVPLILSVMPGIIDYRRNYLDCTVEGCDILTELWFADQASFDTAMATVFEPEVAERIAQDESNFLDRRANRAIIVTEEHGGPLSN